VRRIYEHISKLDRATLPGKVIFTNGCFDILHVGHVTYLEQAKGLGDTLVVGLNSDNSVKQLKGDRRPINSWQDRATVLSALSSVDLVIGFDEETPLQLIQSLRPDVITKGGDYKIEEMIGKSVVESYGGEVIILPYVQGYSTTEILDRKDN